MKKLLCALAALLLACAPALAEGFEDFTAADMDGNEVSREIFADYDLTLVNIWATWCPYCIEELPCFSKLTEALPENVNFITICTDAAEEPELAARILQDANANYQTLVGAGELYDQVAAQVYAFPTTLFIGREGNSVAEPLVGALRAEDPADAFYQVAMGVLGMVEGAA